MPRLTVAATLALGLLTAPLHAQVLPTPESVLGFKPGADFELATYEESVDYFHRLDASSDRITLQTTGRTSEGREWLVALISSEENLRNLEAHRAVAQRLAEAGNLTESEARARSGRRRHRGCQWRAARLRGRRSAAHHPVGLRPREQR